jgi:hypothetical protein
MKRNNACGAAKLPAVSNAGFSGDPRSRHCGFSGRRWDSAHSRAESDGACDPAGAARISIPASGPRFGKEMIGEFNK